MPKFSDIMKSGLLNAKKEGNVLHAERAGR
jgi:hypothetical protein